MSDNAQLKEQLERVLMNKRGDIDRLLADYGVPRMDTAIDSVTH